jgi:hypothetical protein
MTSCVEKTQLITFYLVEVKLPLNFLSKAGCLIFLVTDLVKVVVVHPREEVVLDVIVDPSLEKASDSPAAACSRGNLRRRRRL